MQTSPAADAEKEAAQAATAEGDLTLEAESGARTRPLDRRRLEIPNAFRGPLRALGIFAASRAVVFVCIGVSGIVQRGVTFAGTMGRWDAAWYLDIARSGYPDHVPKAGGAVEASVLAFFPLFPTLVRGAHRIMGLSEIGAAVAVNLVFGAVLAVFLWLLMRDLADEETADRSVAILFFFPASFVLSTPYSEAVMLALAVLCLWALLRRRWLVAGLAAAAATASRPTAVVLCACCAFAAVQAIRRDRDWKALVAPALSPLGLVAFSALLWARTGNPLAWAEAQRAWGRHYDFGATMLRAFGDAVASPGADLNKLAVALTLVFLVPAFVLLARWRPPAVLTIYAAGIVAITVLAPSIPLRPRFAMTAVPLVVVFAVVLRRAAFHSLIGTSAVTLACLTIITATTVAITP